MQRLMKLRMNLALKVKMKKIASMRMKLPKPFIKKKRIKKVMMKLVMGS